VATSLGASLLLEPSNELGDGESLRERVATVSSSRLGRSGRLLSDRRGLLGNRGRRADGSGSLGGRRNRRGRLGGSSWGSRGRARAGTVPDLGAGNGVAGLAAVDVEQDTWVGGAVCLGHVCAGGGEGGGATRDADLTTAVVELGGALAVGLVEGNDLRADQVVAIREVGELDGDLALVGDELLNSPFATGQTLFEDLGPDGTLTLSVGLGNVNHDWSFVGGSDGPVNMVSRWPYMINWQRRLTRRSHLRRWQGHCGATGR
jgi:hypothetical protein